MSEGTGRPRGRETTGDMVRSLLAVLVLVFVVVALTVRDQPESAVQRVDYAGTLALARADAPYDVLAPRGLPTSWRATSARSERVGQDLIWHLGFLTPDGAYAGVEQTDGDPDRFLNDLAADATPAGSVDIDGVSWRRLRGGEPESRALVLSAGEAGDATTAVAGNASWRELRALASALRAD